VYLKRLELVGFKSFAEKTRLDFEPGMTAIVGPNGCGKSNVSDAIRWVIGEQSAKALRGSRMEDCIFNGTDSRKPLGMAEVSLTLADCDSVLEAEYNEVTITRRVFRSGEGQYFLNKTPCRLKDIQRLFMDTGIGTTSYSLMEQGRIDRILSARPEDRRQIFEEASGITKFKADKKEAIRKLEHTEANLLRLSDVIREVKRQIGSLQRQAGKARRYKQFKEEHRKLDVYATRERLRSSDTAIRELQERITALNAAIEQNRGQVEREANANTELRARLRTIEHDMGACIEASVQARSKLDHTRELIQLNHQRIAEYKSWSERDTREIDATTRQLEEGRRHLDALTAQRETLDREQAAADEQFQSSRARFESHRREMDAVRSQIHRLREESVELESRTSHLRNRLVEIESHERSDLIRRERLAAEKKQLASVASDLETRHTGMMDFLAKAREEVAACESTCTAIREQRAALLTEQQALHDRIGLLQSRIAGHEARLELLRDSEEMGEDFPAGARLVLDENNPLALDAECVLGALATHVRAQPAYTVALEAALRFWIDAIVVDRPETAAGILGALAEKQAGAIRLLCKDLSVPQPTSPVNGERLVDHVTCTETLRPLVEQLIGTVYLADSLNDLCAEPQPGISRVTRDGIMLRADGSMERWVSEAAGNPLARQHRISQASDELHTLTTDLADGKSALASLRNTIETQEAELQQAQSALDQARRSVAQKEGESQVVGKEAREARERLETVTFELEAITSQGQSSDAEKEAINKQLTDIREQRERMTRDISDCGTSLQQHESRHSELQADVTERQINASMLKQKVEHIQTQHHAADRRVTELSASVEDRSLGIRSYEARIAELDAQVQEAESHLNSLEEAVDRTEHEAAHLRGAQDRVNAELEEAEAVLNEKREQLEQQRQEKSELDLKVNQRQMQRQNQIERLMSEYSLTEEQVFAEPAPEWGETTPPSLDIIETRIAELRTKMEAMGPVNLIAIEEYKELEERFAFLTAQEDDLVKAKQQLMEMIRKINRTTSELFRDTFDQVNTNFQAMFEKLFRGGSAKLVLINEEDVLECGIEIIARPPGKRLQNISLLSGGERTLTAVALLFAIYMIKPSPFCVLDELDAALDDSNIGRFVEVLQGFIAQSQFLLITHNHHTIAAASVLYGVTMQEKGISRIVSMKFKEAAAAAGD
jgi:chromosome segregation protein